MKESKRDLKTDSTEIHYSPFHLFEYSLLKAIQPIDMMFPWLVMVLDRKYVAQLIRSKIWVAKQWPITHYNTIYGV